MRSEPIRRQLSSSLYEVIAYFGSASLAFVLFSIGLLDDPLFTALKQFFRSLNAAELTILVIIAVTIAYVYGQFASALSASVIGGSVSRFARKFHPKGWHDYNYDFTSLVASFFTEDNHIPDNKKNNRWTLVYLVIVMTPAIGADILKRQARERLARINSMNMALLMTASMAASIVSALGMLPGFHPPSMWFAALCAVLSCLFAYEYYKRRCWNNDLLVKILPAIRSEIVRRDPQRARARRRQT